MLDTLRKAFNNEKKKTYETQPGPALDRQIARLAVINSAVKRKYQGNPGSFSIEYKTDLNARTESLETHNITVHHNGHQVTKADQPHDLGIITVSPYYSRVLNALATSGFSGYMDTDRTL